MSLCYLPFDIIQLIFNYSNVRTKFNILFLNKYMNSNLIVYSFYDHLVFEYKRYRFMGDIIYESTNHKIYHRAHPCILKKYTFIQELNLYENILIRDSDIKHLKNLHTFYANNNISDEGIKHMNLHTLFTNEIISNYILYDNIIEALNT